MLEYDDERSGSFAPLAEIPEGKIVVLGLVSTKSRQLETKNAIAARIQEAARFVPIERLALSPQCGFASSVIGNRLSPDEQRAKLQLVVETARSIWGSA